MSDAPVLQNSAERCENSLKRVRAFVDRPSRVERTLLVEIRQLLAVKLPIRLSHLAVCHPIAVVGLSANAVAFREVTDVVPFVQQIMSLQSRKTVLVRAVHQFASPIPIRQFARTPSCPYWMNVIDPYEFPPRRSLSLTASFHPWGQEGLTCVYAVADRCSKGAVCGCVFVPAHLVPSNVLPLYLVRYEIAD